MLCRLLDHLEFFRQECWLAKIDADDSAWMLLSEAIDDVSKNADDIFSFFAYTHKFVVENAFNEGVVIDARMWIKKALKRMTTYLTGTNQASFSSPFSTASTMLEIKPFFGNNVLPIRLLE